MVVFPENGAFAEARRRMVEEQLRTRGIVDERVLAAMLRVPRHAFTPERLRDQAYGDHPLPIGEGQTISQPYIVASMLQALELTFTDRVLEVGTGSGYVTALLAELAGTVFSIERIESLAASAREMVAGMGNTVVIVGDGAQGLAAAAPFDKITVAAAAEELPAALFSQLAEGGRIIIPVGLPDSQQLQLICKQDGEARVSWRESCRFVPLVRGVGV